MPRSSTGGIDRSPKPRPGLRFRWCAVAEHRGHARRSASDRRSRRQPSSPEESRFAGRVARRQVFRPSWRAGGTEVLSRGLPWTPRSRASARPAEVLPDGRPGRPLDLGGGDRCGAEVKKVTPWRRWSRKDGERRRAAPDVGAPRFDRNQEVRPGGLPETTNQHGSRASSATRRMSRFTPPGRRSPPISWARSGSAGRRRWPSRPWSSSPAHASVAEGSAERGRLLKKARAVQPSAVANWR